MNHVPAVPATCTDKGNNEYYKCTRYNGLFSNEEGTTLTTLEKIMIEATGHSWNDKWKVIKEPTCTESGIEERYCQHAGCKEIEQREIAKLGHD